MVDRFMISFNGKSFEVEVERLAGTAVMPKAIPVASAPQVAQPSAAARHQPVAEPVAAPKAAAGGNTLPAPMPGKIMAIHVKCGDCVKRGDVLLILEAMKMQNEIMAPADGTISDVRVTSGQSVSTGDVMLILA